MLLKKQNLVKVNLFKLVNQLKQLLFLHKLFSKHLNLLNKAKTYKTMMF